MPERFRRRQDEGRAVEEQVEKIGRSIAAPFGLSAAALRSDPDFRPRREAVVQIGMSADTQGDGKEARRAIERRGDRRSGQCAKGRYRARYRRRSCIGGPAQGNAGRSRRLRYGTSHTKPSRTRILDHVHRRSMIDQWVPFGPVVGKVRVYIGDRFGTVIGALGAAATLPTDCEEEPSVFCRMHDFDSCLLRRAAYAIVCRPRPLTH